MDDDDILGPVDYLAVEWPGAHPGAVPVPGAHPGAMAHPAGAPQAAAPVPSAAPVNDVLAQLTQLGELKAAGVLTEAEFEAQKARILNG